jgi:5-amino-6-(5-phosphoribosylamino)uracil reductase
MIDRPYVTLSCAVSLDGFLDDASPERLLLSNAADFDRVDAVRARHDAILVGANTIRRDDPRLMIRSAARRAARQARGLAADPAKITITESGDLPPGAKFFNAGEAIKIIYAPTAAVATLTRLSLPATVVDSGLHVDLDRLLRDLAGRGIGRLLVEGGGTVLTEFLARGCYDELHLAVAPIVVGDDSAPRFIRTGIPIADRVRLAEVRQLGDIAVLRYEAPNALQHALARLLAPVRAVLLDFDGPVTPLLAEGRNAQVADRMRHTLAEHRIALPEELRDTNDPLQILRWATRQRVGDSAAAAAQQACIEGEVAAAHLAPLTAGAQRLLEACQAAALPVIIVSNNSAEAIDAALTRHGLAGLITGVVARVPDQPELMKPDPAPIRRALGLLDRSAAECLLIGDSVTDVEVSMITGVPVIGYARSERRRPGLELAGADVIIDDLRTVAIALTATH